jgi:hypothetical protein
MGKKISFVILAMIVAFVAGFLLTATGVTAAPLLRPRPTVQIVALAFLDTVGYHYDAPCYGCNGIWDSADWCGELYTPLPDITLILRDAETNEEIDRKTARKNYNNGQSWAYFSIPPRDSFVLEVEAVPEGFETCPTSSLSRPIALSDFQHGRRLEKFYFWWGCPPTPPDETPPPPPDDSNPPDEPPPPPPGTDPNYYYGCGVYPIFRHPR